MPKAIKSLVVMLGIFYALGAAAMDDIRPDALDGPLVGFNRDVDFVAKRTGFALLAIARDIATVASITQIPGRAATAVNREMRFLTAAR